MRKNKKHEHFVTPPPKKKKKKLFICSILHKCDKYISFMIDVYNIKAVETFKSNSKNYSERFQIDISTG